LKWNISNRRGGDRERARAKKQKQVEANEKESRKKNQNDSIVTDEMRRTRRRKRVG